MIESRWESLLDPVLCTINKVDVKEEAYNYTYTQVPNKADYSDLLKLLMKNRVDEKLDFNLVRIEKNIE